MRQWFRIAALAEAPDITELYIYDEIGPSWFGDDGVRASALVQQLNALPDSTKTILVRVNSPGGDVFEAATISNALIAQRTERGRTIDVRIEGLAASAATIITSAGAPIRIARNALMMVHRPHTMTYGESDDHRKSADLLDKIEASIIESYRRTSSKSADELAAMMKATTWLDADEAVAAGFATEIVEEAAVEARFRPQAITALGRIPQRIAARATWIHEHRDRAGSAPADVVMQACSDAGLDLTFARSLVDARISNGDLKDRIAGEKRTRDTEASRKTHIRAACTLARLPMLADSLIAGGMSIEATKQLLTTAVALMDTAEIDAHLGPDHGNPNAGAKPWKKVFENVKKSSTSVEAR